MDKIGVELSSKKTHFNADIMYSTFYASNTMYSFITISLYYYSIDSQGVWFVMENAWPYLDIHLDCLPSGSNNHPCIQYTLLRLDLH